MARAKACKWTTDKRKWHHASGGTTTCRITPYDRDFRLVCNDTEFNTELEAFAWGGGVSYLKKVGCTHIRKGK